MSKDEKKPVEVKVLGACEEHGTMTALVKDGDGNVALGTFLDQEKHPEAAEATDHQLVVQGSPNERGWQRGSIERRGPAKVNSQAYREGWERIFGRGQKQPIAEA